VAGGRTRRLQPGAQTVARSVEATAPRGGGILDVMPATALPELAVLRVQRWCRERVPEHARHQVRVECEVEPRHLTIVERRAPWREDLGPEWTRFPIARLRYTKTRSTWSLYWRDRNLRFQEYDLVAPSANIDELLTEVDRDPTGIFWG
jgi:hypothetical protein